MSASRGDFRRRRADERELYLDWLRASTGCRHENARGSHEERVGWAADGVLISLLGIVNHLTHVEWRWVDGSILGGHLDRHEEEFTPAAELSVPAALAAYRDRATATQATVRSLRLDTPAREGYCSDLRWMMIHLINETARHPGHGDSPRELLDETKGEWLNYVAGTPSAGTAIRLKRTPRSHSDPNRQRSVSIPPLDGHPN